MVESQVNGLMCAGLSCLLHFGPSGSYVNTVHQKSTEKILGSLHKNRPATVRRGSSQPLEHTDCLKANGNNVNDGWTSRGKMKDAEVTHRNSDHSLLLLRFQGPQV